MTLTECQKSEPFEHEIATSNGTIMTKISNHQFLEDCIFPFKIKSNALLGKLHESGKLENVFKSNQGKVMEEANGFLRTYMLVHEHMTRPGHAQMKAVTHLDGSQISNWLYRETSKNKMPEMNMAQEEFEQLLKQQLPEPLANETGGDSNSDEYAQHLSVDKAADRQEEEFEDILQQILHPDFA
jgi:hypothetical protein